MPYHIIDETDSSEAPFDGPFVVKLADVRHRTDVGAVRLQVRAVDLDSVVKQLRALAEQLGEPATVVAQPDYRISGELLVGLNAENELDPLVVCGPGRTGDSAQSLTIGDSIWKK